MGTRSKTLHPASSRRDKMKKINGDFTTDEDPDIGNEDNGPEDISEEIFSDHESFREHDTESEEDGDSRNEDVNNLELFSSKEGTEWRKIKFRQNIRCHDIVSLLLGTKRTSERCDKTCEELEIYSSFDPGSMLSLPDRALVVKLDKNGESTAIALRMFRTEEGLNAQKSPISLNGILNLVRRLDETGS
ncbi:hypothetical protein AVEN_174497-1 [Araneus ventricosus]|uniref:Uncharacterized protein n=1 Tax=Araneus ventricosus TaxID=182803 RepID=A0A4Y2VWI0_ARAVE|nr:hypothetical protein AVEN_174497-1 [Araneus ventricosus]